MFGNWKMPACRSLGVGGENKNPLRSRAGFTLLELLIVIAVIGVLAGLFVTQYPAVQRRARDAERRSDIKQYQTAIESYANNNNGNYPTRNNITDLCGDLGITACPDDSYGVSSQSTRYVLWAELEQESDAGDIQYFVVCSDGRSGDTINSPTANCFL